MVGAHSLEQLLRAIVQEKSGSHGEVELAESGKVTPVIDRTYPLSRTSEAIAHVGEGHSQGKTIITMEHSDIHERGT